MNRQYDKSFGKNLKHIREKKNLTQDILAIKLQLAGCDLTRSALAKIEVAQRHVYPDEVKALKEALGVEYTELFDFAAV